jgi:hypothetical protein
MWEISRVPSYLERLECWLYWNSCEEDFEFVRSSIKQFEAVLACFWSASIPCLLGVILAIGNYMNGNTKAGQADGFDLNLLRPGGIDAVRDNQCKGDLRRFVISVFLSQCRKDAVMLLADMRLAFKNVKRTLEPVEGGGLKMKKHVKISLERTCDEALTRVCREFTEQEATRHRIQDVSSCNSMDDNETQSLADKFQRIGERIAELQRLREEVSCKYTRLLQWFHYPADECSDQFFLLWDDFLIPRECFESQQPTKVKSVLKPLFCEQAGDIDVYSLGLLWEIEFGGLPIENTSLTQRGTLQLRAKARSATAPPRGSRRNITREEELAHANIANAEKHSPAVVGSASISEGDAAFSSANPKPDLLENEATKCMEVSAGGRNGICTANAVAPPVGIRNAVNEWPPVPIENSPLAVAIDATTATVDHLLVTHTNSVVPRAPACGPPQCRRRPRRILAC